MSAAEDLFAAHALPVLEHWLGDSATVATPDQATATVTMSATVEETEAVDNADGKQTRRIRFAMVRKPATLSLRSVVTLGGVDYAVESETERTADFSHYKLVRIERTEIARHGYRR